MRLFTSKRFFALVILAISLSGLKGDTSLVSKTEPNSDSLSKNEENKTDAQNTENKDDVKDPNTVDSKVSSVVSDEQSLGTDTSGTNDQTSATIAPQAMDGKETSVNNDDTQTTPIAPQDTSNKDESVKSKPPVMIANLDDNKAAEKESPSTSTKPVDQQPVDSKKDSSNLDETEKSDVNKNQNISGDSNDVKTGQKPVSKDSLSPEQTPVVPSLPQVTAQDSQTEKSKKEETKTKSEEKSKKKKDSNPMKDIINEMKDISQLFKPFRDNDRKNDTKQLREIEDSIFDEGAGFDKEDVISDYKTISVGKVYELSDNWKTVDLPALDETNNSSEAKDGLSPYLVLTVKGYGHLSVKLQSKAHNKHENIHMDSTYEMSYLPIDRHKYLSEGQPKLQIRIEKSLMSMMETPQVKLEFRDFLEMEFNQNQRIYTNFSHEIRYKVTHPEKHLNDEDKEDRLQFIMQSTLNEQTSQGNEDLSMYINKKPIFPSRTNYELRATGNLGYGLIKTLGPKSNSYCIAGGCEFYVTIFSHNVDALFFFPTVFANGSKLSFHKSFFLLEEVEGQETVYYELEVPYHKGDWVFSIQPMEGSPRMAINPDKMVDDVSKAMFKTVGEGAEEITITVKESKMFGFSFKKFFVMFIGSGIKNDVATFKFNVLRMESNEVKKIKLNYAETGVVANKEITQYKLEFFVEEPEFIDFRLKMKTLNGSGMLVVKECETGKNCKVKQSDINRCGKIGYTSLAPREGIDYDNNYNDSTAITGDNPFESDNRRVLVANKGRMLQANGNQYNPYWSPANSTKTQLPVGQTQYVPYQAQNSQPNIPGLIVPQMNLYKPNTLQTQPSRMVGQNPLSYPPQIQTPGLQYNSQYKPYDPTSSNQITAPYQNPEMLTQSDLQKTDIQNINMGNNLDSLLLPPNQFTQTTGGGNKIPDQLIQRDNRQHLIKPGQDLLTGSSPEKMMEKLSDPLLNLVLQEGLMHQKDKELKNIQDYKLLQEEPLEKTDDSQNLDKPVSTDQETPASNDQFLDEFPSSPPTPQPPKEIEYDLEDEINTDYLKCVKGNTEDNNPQEHSIIMKFNCLGRFNTNKGESFEQLDDEYPYSQSCAFAVGVYGANQSNALGGTYYSLLGSGGKTHKSIKFRTSSEFIIQENEVRFFRYDLKNYKPAPEAKLRLKVVAITGSCKVYFSKFNQYPSEFDNESALSFSQEHFMSVRTSEKRTDIPFDSYGSFNSLFVAVDAQEYCVLDFYAEKLNSKDEIINERLHRGKLVKRKLTGKNRVEGNKSSNPDTVVYAENFHFTIKQRPKDHLDKLHVVVNSNVLGLKLCLQMGTKSFVPEKRCDFASETGEVVIPNVFGLLEGGTNYAVGVVLEVSENHAKSVRLPVDFSLIYFDSKNSGQHLQVLDPGRAFTSHVSKHESLVFRINLLENALNSLIVLTTEEKSVHAKISKNANNFADGVYSLDSETFAVELDHFREQLICDAAQEWACFLFVKVTSNSKHRAEFSLTYTVNDIPITLKEGHQLFIPNSKNMYFLYDPNPMYPAELDLQSDLTQFILYSKLLDVKDLKRKELNDLVSEYNYDFKTDIGKSEQLRVPQAEIQKAGVNSVLAFLVAPKFDRLENPEYPILYSSAATARIQVKSRMSKLDGFVEGDATLKKGEFRHFFFEVTEAMDFSLVLTVQTGKAELYLNKGLFHLPTLKDFWKSGGKGRGQEIIITPHMFEQKKEIVGVYTAGIYAKTDCRVAVMFLPAFPNLIKVKLQHVMNMRITKGKDYYFEFFNKLKIWELLMYASDSGLDISIMDFALHKNSHEDMVDILRDDSKYMEHIKFTKGSLPLKHREDKIEIFKHYVVRVRAHEPVAHLDLAIYNPLFPLLVPSGRKLDMVTNSKEKSYFKVELAGDYETALLDFTLIFGNVKVRMADSLAALPKEKQIKVSVPRTIKHTYKPKEKASDIQIFDAFYLEVEAFDFSKFTFNVRGRQQYKEIRPFENEIVYTSTKQDKFVYFEITNFQKNHIKEALLDIDAPNSYSIQPLFFFNPDSEALSLGSETKLLPMPMMDVSDSKKGAFRHIEVRPELQAGYYIAKLPKAQAKTPVRLSLSLNNRRTLQTNGTYRFRMPKDSGSQQKFAMYLPKAGEFRLLVESCNRVSVTKAELNLYKVEKPIIFKENLVQTSHYIVVDDRDPNKFSRMYKNFYSKVFRGQSSQPGALEFVIEENKESLDMFGKKTEFKHRDDEYFLVTEFKPDKRELFFKDYINLWGDEETENIKKYSYSWSEDYQKLNFDIDAPKFHDQLLEDFPDLKKIVIKYFIYALTDEKLFQRMETCGLSALDHSKHTRMTFTQEVDVTTEFNAHQPLRFRFSTEELDKFRASPDLYVFSYIAVSFFENELDQFELGLETKFATTPYVCFVTRNLYDFRPVTTKVVIIISLFVFFVMVFLFCKRSKDTNTQQISEMVQQTKEKVKQYAVGGSSMPDKSEYQAPSGGNGPNRIEMSETQA